jgi:hypothetical protein
MEFLTMLRKSLVGGNALAETIVALTALLPFIGGIVLLGKQLDVKHKSFDALRYSVWERTVWSGSGANAKSDMELTMEIVDRAFGDPRAGVLAAGSLQSAGVSRNPLWQHHGQSLLTSPSGAATSARFRDDVAPVDAGRAFMSALTHGSEPLAATASVLQMDDLGLNPHGFASATIAASIRPFPGSSERPLEQRATGALLSDTWSPRDEQELGRRVDDITANELIERLERPGRVIALQALGKGEPLYGEGQYGWVLRLRPQSNVLPAAYVGERQGE